MNRKTYTGKIRFKSDSDETGEVSAEFATLNMIDHDGDVTRPGAFQAGQETIIEAWNHNYGDLPVGKGAIRENGEKAVFEGRFFLDTAGGLEHYKVVQALGPLQEWSYTFDIEESSLGQFEGQDVQFLEKLDVWGVAPVQRGAGIDTRTVSLKGAAGLSEEEVARLRALLHGKERDVSSDEGASASDTGDGDEGQGASSGDGDVEPSGPPPEVVRTQIEIELLEV